MYFSFTRYTLVNNGTDNSLNRQQVTVVIFFSSPSMFFKYRELYILTHNIRGQYVLLFHTRYNIHYSSYVNNGTDNRQ